MKKAATTVLVDVGVLLALVGLAFGLWHFPWLTLLVLALLLLGGWMGGRKVT